MISQGYIRFYASNTIYFLIFILLLDINVFTIIN